MNVRTKTAAVSTGLNVLLTIAKFILFFLTGSIAILAEAWHSLTDIFTSMMVFFAVREKPAGDVTDSGKSSGTTPDAPIKPPISISDLFNTFNIEQWVSMGIGAFIFIAGLGILNRVFVTPPEIIKQPLVSGLIFLVFSVASYLVYRFETSVGEKENSVGLISDGMHSRADMGASLLTGFSLILYHLGLNIDRLVAGLIVLLVFSFSIETIVNVIASARKDETPTFKYKSHILFASLFNASTWRDFAGYLDNQFNLNLSRSTVWRKADRWFRWGILIIILLAYFSTCLFTLSANQEGITERFGKPINRGSPIQPGLHVKAPWPIDRIIRIDSRTIRSLNIGNITDKNSFALLWTREHGSEEPFISGDNYYFYPYLTLHYSIKDIFKYRYGYDDVMSLVESQAYQISSQYFARKEFFELSTDMRSDMGDKVTGDLQAKLDELECGVEIHTVNFKDIHPPIFIASSFEGVIAAYQEKQQKISYAQGYQNKEVAESRGEAARMVEAANAYVKDKIGRAEGDAGRFLLQLPKSPGYKAVTKIRLFLQAMMNALKDMEIILVDPEAGMPEIWSDFNRAGQIFDLNKEGP